MTVETAAPAMRENVSLRSCNTFGIEARARWFCSVKSADDIRALIRRAPAVADRWLLLGGGSNLLFTRDWDGLVVRVEIQGTEVLTRSPEHVACRAGAGVEWDSFVRFCVEHGWGGLENLSLIPGTVGAAAVGNIGAYGVEAGSLITTVEAVDIRDGSPYAFDRDACAFDYRRSAFKRPENRFLCVTSVTFSLAVQPVFVTGYAALADRLRDMHIAQPTLRDIRDAVIAIRRDKLPDPARIGNAGSFFKNPEIPAAGYEALRGRFPDMPGFALAGGERVRVPAAWLIDRCGWKGRSLGHAGVHERHALVLVNNGGATGAEILALSQDIVRSVQERFGLELTPEVCVV